MSVEPIDQLVWYIRGEGAIGNYQFFYPLKNCSLQILLGIGE